jgi:DNA-directed RNA polymerase specialized sigma24 family protein
MAHTDLEALKERLRTAQPAKVKRVYAKRPKIGEARRAELMIKLRESSDFLEELKLELDALTYQAYKTGLKIEDIADALKINNSAVAKRIQRLRATLKK